MNPLRLDPTRTTLLRRRFGKELSVGFEWLIQELVDLIKVEDAFGLKNPMSLNAANCGAGKPGAPGFQKGNTCAAGGESLKLATDQEVQDFRHLAVKHIAKEMAEHNSWKYHGEIEVLDQEGELFDVGGVSWHKGGECGLDSGKITLYARSMGDTPETVSRLIAHEMMHGVFEKVYKAYHEETKRVESKHIKADGSLKEEYESEFPVYSAMFQVMDKSVHNYSTGELRWVRQDLEDKDGVTDYSRAYWEDYKAGKVSQHIAIHETLAELASIHETTGTLVGDKVWRDLYKTVRKEYLYSVGASKRRKKRNPTTNENFLHVLYLDSDLKPTRKEEATVLRYWKNSNQHGWAFKDGPTANQRWKFATNALGDFDEWLQQKIEQGVVNKDLVYKTIKSAHGKGVSRGYGDKRRLKSLFSPSGVVTASAKEEFLQSGMLKANSLQNLQARTFNDLKGITQAMAGQINRVLSDGLIAGKTADQIAADLVDRVQKIGITRAKVLAETEIVRAHSEGVLDALENLGETQVQINVEWHTTNSPCELCAPLKGMVLTIQQARGMFPRHPRCRCSPMPTKSRPHKTKTKSKIDKSVMAEVPKSKKKRRKSKAMQRKRSSWFGASKK